MLNIGIVYGNSTYPCYKVIQSDGKLGGYGFGCDDKIRRLEKDGIEIIDGKIDNKYFL